MDYRIFTAGADDNDRRLDRIVRKFIQGDSLSLLYKALRKGLIKLNGAKASAEKHVFEGDQISIAAFLVEEKNETKEPSASVNNTLDIIFQNEHILVINKSYDVTVQGGNNSLNETVEAFYRENFSASSLSFRTGPLHRLDRKTTGLLCFSLSLKGARWFSENIATHNIKKVYSGILQGHLSDKQKWEDSISKNYDGTDSFQTVKITRAGTPGDEGKKAITTVTPKAWGSRNGTDFTLAEFKIETGRTHQIRAQSSFHGFPLLGDRAYGGNKIPETEYFLHAETLFFPKDNPLCLPERISAPFPEKFQIFLKTNMKDSVL